MKNDALLRYWNMFLSYFAKQKPKDELKDKMELSYNGYGRWDRSTLDVQQKIIFTQRLTCSTLVPIHQLLPRLQQLGLAGTTIKCSSTNYSVYWSAKFSGFETKLHLFHHQVLCCAMGEPRLNRDWWWVIHGHILIVVSFGKCKTLEYNSTIIHGACSTTRYPRAYTLICLEAIANRSTMTGLCAHLKCHRYNG